MDAFALGYQEAANDDQITPSDNTVTFASYDGYGKAALITMAGVEIGNMSFKNVDFLAFDVPQVTGFDVVLGQSVLQSTKLELDYSLRQLKLEKIIE